MDQIFLGDVALKDGLNALDFFTGRHLDEVAAADVDAATFG